MSAQASKEIKEPLFRITKRGSITAGKAWAIRGLALLGALLTGALLILLLGHNPFEVYASMIGGAFGKKIAIQETVKLTIPLLITGIGLAFAFKMKFWNIGGEGQILMGGVAASAVAIYGTSLPHEPKLLQISTAAISVGGQ